MILVPVIVGVVLVAVAVWAVRFATTPSVAEQASLAFAERARLTPEPEVLALGARHLRHRAVAGAGGAVVGGVAVAVWMASIPGDAALVPVWALVGAVIGRAITLVLLAVVSAWRRPPEGGPRVARATRTGVRDYVPVGELVVGFGAAVLPALVLVVWGSVVGAEPALAGAWPVVVPLVVLVVAGLGARRIVRRPQPARSSVELAWDDALRARTLRDLVAGVGLVGASYGLLSVMVVAVVPSAPIPDVPGRVLAVVLVAVALATVLVTMVPGPAAQFRRRLWARSEEAFTAGATS